MSPPPPSERIPGNGYVLTSLQPYVRTYVCTGYPLTWLCPSHVLHVCILLWWGDIPPTYHSSMNSLGCMSNDMDLMRCLCLHIVPGVTDGGCTQPKVAVCKCAPVPIHAYTYIPHSTPTHTHTPTGNHPQPMVYFLQITYRRSWLLSVGAYDTWQQQNRRLTQNRHLT